jgi:Fe2+ or Zn2+ uptake regulation protein
LQLVAITRIIMTNQPLLSSLRQQGYRLTPQRLAVLRILRESDGHLSPVEIYQRAIADVPGITEPTVYRSLSFLVEQGLVRASYSGGSRVVYESAGHDHDHLTCRQCGDSLEIDPALLGGLYDKLSLQTGFKIDSSHMNFFGLCPDCQIP